MTTRSRLGGGSIASRLFVVIALPLVALGFLGIQRVDQERGAADDAREIVRRAEIQSSVAAVIGPARLEQIALEGLSRVDEIGVPRDAVVDLSGIDLEEIYDPNRIALDAALERLDGRHGDLPLEDGGSFSDRLEPIIADLSEQRRLYRGLQARPASVRDVFDRLDDALTDALRLDQRNDDRSGTAVGAPSVERARLRALADVVTEAGRRGRALLDGLIRPSQESSFELIVATARLDTTLDIYRAQIPPERAALFESVDRDLLPIPTELLSIGGQRDGPADEASLDPELVRGTALALLDQITYLDALGEYSEVANAYAVDTLEERARSAENSAQRTAIGIGFVLVSTITILFVVGGSVLRPLKRLTHRASLIGRGDLDGCAEVVRGPSDVRTLTIAMNQMISTLRNVESQISGLADGTRSALSTLPPGAIGVSLRQSFENLEETTSRLHASEELSSAIVAQAADAI